MGGQPMTTRKEANGMPQKGSGELLQPKPSLALVVLGEAVLEELLAGHKGLDHRGKVGMGAVAPAVRGR